jgi:hypothetical protein
VHKPGLSLQDLKVSADICRKLYPQLSWFAGKKKIVELERASYRVKQAKFSKKVKEREHTFNRLRGQPWRALGLRLTSTG